MTGKVTRTREFTGRHMAAILVTFFGVVIAVNFTMAHYASSTFGGTVVDNSYVASQQFNGWLKKARQERALGWSVDLVRTPEDRLTVTIAGAGAPMPDAHVTALARHPLGRLPERSLRFRGLGGGRYASIDTLPAGRWIVHLKVDAHGRELKHVVDLQ